MHLIIRPIFLWALFAICSAATVLPRGVLLNRLASRAINNAVDLKIMPLGASITYGVASTDGNGYRLELRNLLQAGGNNVSYVGTQFNGTMTNNASEGYPGRRISEVGDLAETSGVYDYLPNLVLIHVGTNDCIQNYNTTDAPSRLVTLVQEVLKAIPGTTVFVSNLVPNRDAVVEQCILTFNSAIEENIQSLIDEGLKVVFVDMHSAVSTSDINESDGTHPTDEGYRKMAQVWYGSMVNASSKITPPDSDGEPAPV